ncbi:FAD-dependent oxidoreductase [Nannocystis pusilla]|uniref:FAD-dependent oxidoreductase n=1 Tax=Nannocystis pusilla TaxID=889268 RepID=UPI003B82E27B
MITPTSIPTGARPSLVGSNIIDAGRVAHWSDAAIVARTCHELMENLPAARAATLRHATVHRIPLAVQAPLPGFEARRPAARSPVEGLLLAGDWTRTGLPSSMESAAASGWRAAELVGADTAARWRWAAAAAARPPGAGVDGRVAGRPVAASMRRATARRV